MSLPLQPMSTAPRDGTPVWVRVNNDIFMRLACKGEGSPWVSPSGAAYYFEDEELSSDGWFDIEALARDSERLTKLIERLNFSKTDTISELFDAAYEIAAYSNGDTEDYQRWVRAAIDKEATVDNKQAAETLRTHADITRRMQESAVDLMVADAAERGADAIKMMEWLFAPEFSTIRVLQLHRAWDGQSPFRAYCEQQWREHGRK